MSATEDADNLLKTYFNAYCKFSFYENQVALFEGRNYNVIWSFLHILIMMKTKDKTFQEVREQLHNLNKLVDVSIEEYKKNYATLCHMDNTLCQKINAYKRDDIKKLANAKIEKLFEDFFIAHRDAMENKENILIEEILIEFNNFLSHFNSYLKDNKLPSGRTHLFRGCLDGHKDIILENIDIIKEDTQLSKELMELRISEYKDIGKASSENNHTNTIRKYREVAQNIMTFKASIKK